MSNLEGEQKPMEGSIVGPAGNGRNHGSNSSVEQGPEVGRPPCAPRRLRPWRADHERVGDRVGGRDSFGRSGRSDDHGPACFGRGERRDASATRAVATDIWICGTNGFGCSCRAPRVSSTSLLGGRDSGVSAARARLRPRSERAHHEGAACSVLAESEQIGRYIGSGGTASAASHDGVQRPVRTDIGCNRQREHIEVGHHEAWRGRSNVVARGRR